MKRPFLVHPEEKLSKVMNQQIGYMGVCIAIPEDIRAYLSPRPEQSSRLSYFADRCEFDSIAADTSSAMAVIYCGPFSKDRLSTLHDWANYGCFGSIILIGFEWKTNEVVAAIKLGFSDVLELPENPAESAKAILQAIQENVNTHHDTTRATIPDELTDRLSVEQAKILELILLGKTTKQIGSILDLSVRTIHYRKKDLFLRMGVRDKREAIEYVRLASKRTFLAPAETPIRRYDESSLNSTTLPKLTDSQTGNTSLSPVLSSFSYVSVEADSPIP